MGQTFCKYHYFHPWSVKVVLSQCFLNEISSFWVIYFWKTSKKPSNFSCKKTSQLLYYAGKCTRPMNTIKRKLYNIQLSLSDAADEVRMLFDHFFLSQDNNHSTVIVHLRQKKMAKKHSHFICSIWPSIKTKIYYSRLSI